MTTRSPEQYDWTKALFNDRRLSKNFTSPRRSKITHVTLHHMTIVAPVDKPRSTVAVEAAYDTWMGGRQASANYGVSGELVWQYVSDFDAAWSDANSTSTHSTLSIEHANSTAGPGWEISAATMRTGQRLVACLHRLYGLGRPTRKTVRVHRDYYATACPGPYMMAHLDEYIAAAAHFYDHPDDSDSTSPEPDPSGSAPLDVLNPTSYPDAEHPNRNTTGPQITWLGERLVAHGFDDRYRSGPGPNWSDADRENVADFQKAQGWTGDDADGYPGPTTLRLLAADPKPKPKTVDLTFLFLPLAGYNPDNAPGVKKWPANTDAAVAIVKKVNPDLGGTTELSNRAINKMLPRFDKGLAETHVIRVNGGTDGRHVLRNKVTTHWVSGWSISGHFEAPKASLLNGDDKQAAYAAVEHESGLRLVVVSGHTENQDGAGADAKRVAQALSFGKQGEDVGRLTDADYVIYSLDSNSDAMVRNALVANGWTVGAPGHFVGWKRDRSHPFDLICVKALKGQPTPKLTAEHHINPGSDHEYLVGHLTLIA